MAMHRDEASARSEYGAEFRNDLEGYVSREIVDACTDDATSRPPDSRYTYRAFVNPAGGSGQDFFTLAIAHTERVSHVTTHVLDLLVEIRPPFSPEDAVERFVRHLREYGVTASTIAWRAPGRRSTPGHLLRLPSQLAAKPVEDSVECDGVQLVTEKPTEIVFSYSQAEGYRLVPANGALGGRTTKGDFRIEFFVEAPRIADTESFALDEHGHLGAKLYSIPSPTIERRLTAGVPPQCGRGPEAGALDS